MDQRPVNTAIKVKVTFAISKRGPYEADDSPETTVEVVLGAAMTHFGVADDAQFTYQLTHDGEVAPGASTIGSLAGNAHAIAFRLVKEITQG